MPVNKRRPLYLKAVDVVALLLVGSMAVGATTYAFDPGPEALIWRVVDFVPALIGAIWWTSLALDVRYLWTAKETGLLSLLKRPFRSAG